MRDNGEAQALLNELVRYANSLLEADVLTVMMAYTLCKLADRMLRTLMEDYLLKAGEVDGPGGDT